MYICVSFINVGSYSIIIIIIFEYKEIQRRLNGDVSFDHGWEGYVHGFGNLASSFWFGKLKYLRIVYIVFYFFNHYHLLEMRVIAYLTLVYLM